MLPFEPFIALLAYQKGSHDPGHPPPRLTKNTMTYLPKRLTDPVDLVAVTKNSTC